MLANGLYYEEGSRAFSPGKIFQKTMFRSAIWCNLKISFLLPHITSIFYVMV